MDVESYTTGNGGISKTYSVAALSCSCRAQPIYFAFGRGAGVKYFAGTG